MSRIILVSLLLSFLLTSSSGHIHSQKVSGLQRSDLGAGTWACALFSSALVGACGIFPLFLNKWIRLDAGCKESVAFKVVLSFAIGGLLGDVFLHLLPEAYGAHQSSGHKETVRQRQFIGLWVIVGAFTFLAVEKMMLLTEVSEKEEGRDTVIPVEETESALLPVMEVESMSSDGVMTKSRTFGCVLPNGNSNSNCNGNVDTSVLHTHEAAALTRRELHPISKYPSAASSFLPETPTPSPLDTLWSKALQWLEGTSLLFSNLFQKDASGYLNLVANCTDNFTHGLAIAAGYVVSPAVGMLTTLAILCHEVPHEVGDFAILLNSGFSLREAAKAQVITASGGFVGVVVGLAAEHVASASTWLLPFTAGGFLYIALVSILPGLLEAATPTPAESRTAKWWPMIEVIAVVMGIVVMALVTIVEKKSCGHIPHHVLGS